MLGNNVIPSHLITEFLQKNDLLPRRIDHLSVFDKRHVEQGMKMTEEDKMQRDYENMIDSVKLERAKVADRDAEIVELKKHIESNHEDLRAARKLRKQHEKQIKILQAENDLLRAECELACAVQAENAKRDDRIRAQSKVFNLSERLGNLTDDLRLLI